MFDVNDYEGGAPVEALAEYGEGGLYPIHINDRFQDGRYQILNKLGFGGWSTVWAARDHHTDTDVSLKVIKAKHSEDNKELRILQRIQEDATTQHPGHKYLPRLLDHFYESSPGKRNLFIVLELLGPTVTDVSRFLPNHRFSLSRARQFTKQLLLAVDYLHSHGIVHGDIYEGNILFRLPLPDSERLIFDNVLKGDVCRKDGAPLEEGVPRNLVMPLEYTDCLDEEELEEFDHIQLIDFSSSFFDSEHPEWISTPDHTVPPELIFRKPLSKSVDIWSLACTIFHLVTGDFLFETWIGERDIIPQIHKLLGESSAHWLLTAWIDAVANDKWKDLRPIRMNDASEEMTLQGLMEHCSENSIFDADKKLGRVLEQFLQKALIVDPSKRPTTKELEAEEWVDVLEKEGGGKKEEEKEDEKGE